MKLSGTPQIKPKPIYNALMVLMPLSRLRSPRPAPFRSEPLIRSRRKGKNFHHALCRFGSVEAVPGTWLLQKNAERSRVCDGKGWEGDIANEGLLVEVGSRFGGGGYSTSKVARWMLEVSLVRRDAQAQHVSSIEQSHAPARALKLKQAKAFKPVIKPGKSHPTNNKTSKTGKSNNRKIP